MTHRAKEIAMPNIKLIALDLDGTLLTSAKTLSERNAAALARAAENGVYIVPTTGRFFMGMPAFLRALPYLRYAITINGAAIYDAKQQRDIATVNIPLLQAVEILRYLDSFPLIYDCYMDNWGWMTRAMQDKAEDFVPNEHYLKMIRTLRTPVDELKAYLLEKGHDVQKIQFFTHDLSLRARMLQNLDKQFPSIVASSAAPNNVEINHKDANKGEAVLRLASLLGIGQEQTMAFGDGLNDVSMLQAAGLGVAMANAEQAAKDAADCVSASNDEDGVALAIERYCF